MQHPVLVENLRHAYGRHKIYDDLSLRFERGKVYGLLGKNGVGKTTLIKIIMGFLKPLGGSCRVFGDPAHALRPATRERVGLLFERHLTYDFFTIRQVEWFMSSFYPRWKSERFWALADVLGLPPSHRIAHMSEGQRSQIVLGLMLAQDPELLILDDYSLGLDAGYRRLFVDYLAEYLRDGQHTVILTSHVIQDMDRFVDEAIFLRRGGGSLTMPLKDFQHRFAGWRLDRASVNGETLPLLERMASGHLPPGACLVNAESHADRFEFFAFASLHEVEGTLRQAGIPLPEGALVPLPLNLEDAFVGYTGRR